jgi:LmbE family N-acetylglucosaminyl deacetylase
VRRYYMSPHLDDAALSCAGLMAKQSEQGEEVCVINMFAGIPPFAEHEFSPYAQKQHSKWQLKPQEAVVARRREDEDVLERLGTRVENWDYYDAIYRSVNQEFLYTDHQKLFGPIHPAEDSLINHLVQRLEKMTQDSPDSIFYAPLQVGGHVDHLIARTCAIRLHTAGAKVIFYEDFPYVGRAEWKDEPTTVDKAKQKLPFEVRPLVERIDVNAKIEALKGYKSQLFSLFGDWEGKGLADEVKAYTSRIRQEAGFSEGYFERYWQPA